jgi:hypothetical protein
MVEVVIGGRTKECMKPVVDKILVHDSKHIYTDGFNGCLSLIEKHIHKPGRYLTNRIESV